MRNEYLDDFVYRRNASYVIMEDFGNKYNDFGKFFDMIVEDTISHKLIWQPVFDKNLIWDEYKRERILLEPIIRCRIGKRYLYAELNEIYEYEHQAYKKTIKALYSYVNNKYKSYLDSDFEDDYMYDEARFIYGADDALHELYKAVKEVYGDIFTLFERERAIRRINFLNEFYDKTCSQYIECRVRAKDKMYTYKNNFISCEFDERIYVGRGIEENNSYFQVNKSEIDDLLKVAYGDIDISESDKRFIKLIQDYV